MNGNNKVIQAPALRVQLLQQAATLTGGERNIDYGDPVENHKHIAKIASAITGLEIDAKTVVAVQMATKLGRMSSSPGKRDHYIDLMAYAGILYECVEAE